MKEETSASLTQIKKIKSLAHIALLSYAKERKITKNIAKTYLKEAHYEIKGRTYLGLAFENRVGGILGSGQNADFV